ncbi:hypothetical protein G7Y89_g9681 [Cudoniella acicularis]|uniref:C2H2-type domain-containing protein n=1 Tax=Cudoniella acicularis TaxID=354080 RepID=A0A8H4RFR1_9HELO|nr:hypothetical protein G7Y89_g9681 [Cudoniella acicularis]
MESELENLRRQLQEEQHKREAAELQLSQEKQRREEAEATIKRSRFWELGARLNITEDVIELAATRKLQLSLSLQWIVSKFEHILNDDSWAEKRWGIAIPLYGSSLKLNIWKREIGYEDGVLDRIQDNEGFRDLAEKTYLRFLAIQSLLGKFEKRYMSSPRIIGLNLDARDILEPLQASVDALVDKAEMFDHFSDSGQTSQLRLGDAARSLATQNEPGGEVTPNIDTQFLHTYLQYRYPVISDVLLQRLCQIMTWKRTVLRQWDQDTRPRITMYPTITREERQLPPEKPLAMEELQHPPEIPVAMSSRSRPSARSQVRSIIDSRLIQYSTTSILPKEMYVPAATTVSAPFNDTFIYPNPPADDVCFLCHLPATLLPPAQERGRKKKWRKHLKGHIQPYFCFVEDCPDKYMFFSNKAHWIEHVETHSLPWKEDKLKVLIPSFPNIDASNLREFSNLAQMAEFWTKRIFNSCPFCQKESSRDGLVGPMYHLESHIAQHYEVLSLALLPLEEFGGQYPDDAISSSRTGDESRILDMDILRDDNLDFSYPASETESILEMGPIDEPPELNKPVSWESVLDQQKFNQMENDPVLEKFKWYRITHVLDDTPSKRTNVPEPASASEVPRDDVVYKIVSVFSNPTPHKPVLLFGPKGIGKSQIALQYCYRQKKNYQLMLWIDAKNPRNMEVDVNNAIYLITRQEQKLPLSKAVSRLKDKLLEFDGDWFLGLDDVTSSTEEMCKDLVQLSAAGSILVTSQEERRELYAECFQVPKLTIDQSLSILRHSGNQSADPDDSALLELADRLDYNPSALQKVATRMENKQSPRQILEELWDFEEKILKDDLLKQHIPLELKQITKSETSSTQLLGKDVEQSRVQLLSYKRAQACVSTTQVSTENVRKGLFLKYIPKPRTETGVPGKEQLSREKNARQRAVKKMLHDGKENMSRGIAQSEGQE